MSQDYYLACDDCAESLFVHKWPGWAMHRDQIEGELLPWLVMTYEFLRQHQGHRTLILNFDEYPHGEKAYAEMDAEKLYDEALARRSMA